VAEAILTPRSLAGLSVTKVHARSQYLNLLVYGDSGIGKTTLAGSSDEVPDMRPVLFVDMEGGTESLRTTFPEVDTVRVTNWGEMVNLYKVLGDGNTGYQTVVLDSLTEIQKFNMYNIMTKVTTEHPERDFDVPSMREWGQNLEQMRRFVRLFRDLPMNVIFTALARKDKNQVNGREETLPALSGKLSGEVAAFLDIVVYYYMKKVREGEGEAAKDVDKRMLLTTKTDTIIAKDRTTKLPPVIKDPTMKKLHTLITSTPKSTSAETQENAS
jgi:hypothetical protein